MNGWLKLLISVVIGVPVGCIWAMLLLQFGVEAALVGIAVVLVSEMVYIRIEISGKKEGK